MGLKEDSLKLHSEHKGKLEIRSKVKIENQEDLSLAYTPGVAYACKEIEANPLEAYKYTSKSNMVAVITDGSAVLGLGNIGPYAAIPVMEGKSILLKELAGVDSIPICLKTQDVEEIIKTCKYLEPTLGAINLEDISAPRCVTIERRLIEEMDIPVFHDDQHGTAIVVLAGIINALKIVKKEKEDLKVVINGAGAAGIAIAKLLINYGIKAENIKLLGRHGILSPSNTYLNWAQIEMAKITNSADINGDLKDAVVGTDIFIGVSAPGVLTAEMVKTMNKDSIIFAMANPVPEIMPDEAKAAGARIIGTGRSEVTNKINNVIAFPGIFKGALEGRAPQITEEMKLAVAKAIASVVSDDELSEDYVIPEAFNPKVKDVVSQAVKDLI